MSNILYITQGQKLKTHQDQLVVLVEEESVTIEPDQLEVIIVESTYCSLTANALLMCQEKGVPIIICNEKHQPTVLFDSLYGYHQLSSSIKEQLS